jgi:uncharacterized membrane protein YgdD (TMEM256/DUF423 family)
MSARTSLILGTVGGMLAVALGAFGAHGLKPMLTATGRFETYNLAVEYQFYHSLALLLMGVLMQHYPSRKMNYAAISFTAGLILFSGSLYVLSILNLSFFGAITPFGGVCFIAGWMFALLGILGNKKASP